MTEIVNLMDITDRAGESFTARSSVIQRRKTLGEDAVRALFDITQQHWNQQATHPKWHGLNLFAVDGVVWRTPDTPENSALSADLPDEMVLVAIRRSGWSA